MCKQKYTAWREWPTRKKTPGKGFELGRVEGKWVPDDVRFGVVISSTRVGACHSQPRLLARRPLRTHTHAGHTQDFCTLLERVEASGRDDLFVQTVKCRGQCERGTNQRRSYRMCPRRASRASLPERRRFC